MKRVVIVQSNYIPWKGYFDLFNLADDVVLYDDVQYTKRDWRNRNRIKTATGVQWLTVPVLVAGKYEQAIKEVKVENQAWRAKHWRTLAHSYARAPHFSALAPIFEKLYLESSEEMLSQINYGFIKALCDLIGVRARLHWSWDYELVDGKSERLLGLCKQLGATHYLSGPAARGYLDTKLFEDSGVAVEWMDYAGYPEYPQLHPPFDHSVTVLDTLFMLGAEGTRGVMKTFST